MTDHQCTPPVRLLPSTTDELSTQITFSEICISLLVQLHTYGRVECKQIINVQVLFGPGSSSWPPSMNGWRDRPHTTNFSLCPWVTRPFSVSVCQASTAQLVVRCPCNPVWCSIARSILLGASRLRGFPPWSQHRLWFHSLIFWMRV